MSNWYELDSIDVLERLGADATHGLDCSEVARRLQKHGFNELKEQSGQNPWQILWEQLTATVVIILIVSALISALLGDFKDAVAILTIVTFNAFLGFKQEYQAERSLAALKKLTVPKAKVKRDRTIQEISARELVPGDIVLLEAGNLVPADCRLLESANLRIQEASLTGESEPTDKNIQSLEKELPLGDRHNMAYMGTAVTYGRGVAIVTATGMDTELGHIAAATQTVTREPTRLQQRLDRLGRVLAIAILIIVIVLFCLGLARGEPIKLMFLMAVSLGVAAIPEGLPAVVTIALALGAQRMFKQRVLVRKLPAVETLGSVTVICSDKTGTLTENRMTVTHLSVAEEQIDLSKHLSSEGSTLLRERSDLVLLLVAAALCNDAILSEEQNESQTLQGIGDPTEVALAIAAADLGVKKVDLEPSCPRVAELSFDGLRKRMTTIHQVPSNNIVGTSDLNFQNPSVNYLYNLKNGVLDNFPYVAFVKGAVDSLMNISSAIWVDERVEPLNDSWRNKIVRLNEGLAQEGMRVLGLAFRPLESLPNNHYVAELEQDLIFIGMVSMSDPTRPEVKDAVQVCHTAGIRPVMITGDHPLTARHIAGELGIAIDHQLLTGQDLDQSPQDLLDSIESVSVYARVSPQHKLKIVQALQNRGHIVAMTGDGVNDAPALKKADIGIAMGITGTDVAKEAADMVLLDDNFATIVAVTKEGRVIYDNIRKFIKYTLTGNCGELWVIFLAPFFGMPLPLLPLQILWINLLADGILALALGVEPAENNIMQRPPYQPNESIFARGVGRDIVWVGLLLGILLLGVAYQSWSSVAAAPALRDRPSWQTMVFTTLAFSRIGLAQTMRSERESVFNMSLLANKLLLGAVFFTFSIQLAVVYLPFFQKVFETTALSIIELTISLVISTIVFWAMEIEKFFLRRRQNK
ncbi:cation-translocating P-type ATPase [Pleurocapsales cyanobacterium LEGE 06147]|nr:cation-translocating P-type ATPase [Pleurocapsales cyanobacterium LEGE 06147]